MSAVQIRPWAPFSRQGHRPRFKDAAATALRYAKADFMDQRPDRITDFQRWYSGIQKALKLEQQQCKSAFIRNLNENYCGMLFNWAIVAPETLNLSFSIAKGASNPLESVYASGVIV